MIRSRSSLTPIDRRVFCAGAAALLLRSTPLLAQAPSGASTRPDVAAIDRERILSAHGCTDRVATTFKQKNVRF